ncbi:peptidase M49, dipeptidyl-peptidase III, partial [Polyplosphaeria fusca]
RGYFAVLKVLVSQQGFVGLTKSEDSKSFTVQLDRSKTESHGRKAVEQFLPELHMWRCTGDVEAASERYGSLTTVDEDWLEFRDIVMNRPARPWAFIQGSTSVGENEEIGLKEYPETPEGLIQSWAERFESF